MSRRRFLIPCLFLLSFFAASWVQAEPPPPSRVGRVAVVDGNLAARPAGGEWTDWAVNNPVAAGMALRTGPRDRAALRIGADTVALAAASQLDMGGLDRRNTDLVLRQGRIAVRLSPLDPARNVEIDLPRGAVWLTAPGDYDITAGDEHAPARVTVFAGQAHLVADGLDDIAKAGSTVALTSGEAGAARTEDAVADAFEAWWRPAANDDADGQARHFVSPGVTGYAALDDNGSWETVNGYGAVWFPNSVPAGWVPYRLGHWRWIAPWGWTWIDNMPWGFATSHYGRWAVIPGADPGTERWGWVPGSPIADPAYAPALVAFLGTAGVGISYPDAGGPAVAWFPLAPGEVYWPSYSSDPDAIRRLNEGAGVDLAALGPPADGGPPAAVINGEYENRRFASVVPRAVFLAGQPVAPALVRLPDQRLDNAPLLAGSPQLAPPAPRAVAVAATAVPVRARRLAEAVAPRVTRAIHTLARILGRRGRAAPARAALVARGRHREPALRLAIAGHWRAPRVRLLARPHIIAAVASRSARLRLAAAQRRRIR